MKPGDTVFHPELGEGRIVRVIPRGGTRGVWADFGYLKDWVAWDALQFPDGTDPSPAGIALDGFQPASDGGGIAPIQKDVVDARRAVLALKLGQVPEEHVLELSTGIEGERRAIEVAIDSVTLGRPASILFKGAWGTGKTHLLTMLKALAADRGLATASVILDGEGVTLTDPMRLMADLLSSLRFPGESVPIDFTSRLASLRKIYRGDFIREDGDRLLDAVFRIPISAFDEPEVSEVIADYFMLRVSASQANVKLRQLGHHVTLGPLIARKKDHRADRFCELLHGWVEFCSYERAKGLVVILDELDVEYDRTLRDTRKNIELRSTRQTLLAAFGRLLNQQSTPLLVAFGVAPATDDVGMENDAVQNLRRWISGIAEIEAPTPDIDQTRQLGWRLQEHYVRAYPDRMARIDRNKLALLIDEFAEHHQADSNPIPRTFVRGTLERLDVASELSRFAKTT